jgi:ethanolamine utilization protein EutA
LAARREREGCNDAVNLLGLDFGSTTSSALVASARIGVSSATGRTEFGNLSVLY